MVFSSADMHEEVKIRRRKQVLVEFLAKKIYADALF
jgi:hypothetical protein